MPNNSICTEFWWDWWINAAVALATFIAVLVALFGQAFRAKFFPPKLSLHILNTDGERTKTLLKSEQEDGSVNSRMEDSRYYHLRVSNRRRWSPANQVQIVLLQVKEPAADDTYQIVWSGAIPIGWRHQQLYPTSRTIGAPADIDLCSVVNGNWLEIHPLVIPFNLEVRRRNPTKFIMSLQAQASEADSSIIQVKITWDGKWHDGAHEMKQHLRVEILSENES